MFQGPWRGERGVGRPPPLPPHLSHTNVSRAWRVCVSVHIGVLVMAYTYAGVDYGFLRK